VYAELVAAPILASLGLCVLAIEAFLAVSRDAFQGLTEGSMVFHPKKYRLISVSNYKLYLTWRRRVNRSVDERIGRTSSIIGIRRI
jgi:hypothetical protein